MEPSRLARYLLQHVKSHPAGVSHKEEIHMKRIVIALVVISLGAFLVSADVVGSRHDLTTATGTAFSTTGDTDQVCVFCHTPHGADILSGPLWNRDTDDTGFTMYTSNTLDMSIAGAPQGVSLACLSCHDGTIGFDVLINAPTSVSGTYNYTAGGVTQGWTFTGSTSLAGEGFPTELGKNLSSEHPISITYDPALDTAFDTIANAEADGVRFFNPGANQVECGSCHDPHMTAIVPFLRVSNAASALCVACHIK